MIDNLEEAQYTSLMRQILDQGFEKVDRTGVGTKGIFGASMRFDLSRGFPLFTTRQISFRIAFEEMMFFLRGHTDTRLLEALGISIWKDNTTRSFLDSRGLSNLPVGDMGKGYGFQLRRFGGSDSYEGVDQLRCLVENIVKSPHDRRHMISYWNPTQIKDAVLPPCHTTYYCQVEGSKLNGLFWMRSSDVYHGAPYNIAGYAYLTHLIASLTGYKPGVLVYQAGDAHLYKTQLEVVTEQLERAPKPFPTLVFKKEFSNLDQALSLEFEDIEILNYQHSGKLRKIGMAV